MSENYRLPTTVADIAAEAGISKGHAMTLFQKQMNTSMISYLNELRLRHAQSALANSNEKIVNIAFDAGFGSMSQFYEVFQRATGDSPQVWRNSQH
ncbi:helix-turn-helix transcriptional regulator [SAR116 cluster bacterium]|nr:helix-turn-helix transcriptional regulator [SAR116 cluster bacterium]